MDTIEETSGGGAVEVGEMLKDTAEDETIGGGKADGGADVAGEAAVERGGSISYSDSDGGRAGGVEGWKVQGSVELHQGN